MKIPKARQLPSGSWFVRVRVNGKDIGITRQTEKEAIAEAMALKAGIKEEESRAPKDMTLREAIDEYIEMREATLSPSTIRGYKIIRDNRFDMVMDKTINRTTDKMYQQAINADTKKYSAKTVRNSWGFISTVLKTIAERDVNCSTPQVIVKEHEFLEPEQITAFVNAIKGHQKEIPMLLALHGLRASEVLDVTWKDIDLKKRIIKVRGSAVLDSSNKIVHKETNKNSSSRRDVPIMIPRLADAVSEADRSGDYICDFTPPALHHAITRVCKSNDLPLVGIHGLRHSFASLCYHLGLPEEMTMRLGGWNDSGTMRKIYTHLASKDIHKYTSALEAFFSKGTGND